MAAHLFKRLAAVDYIPGEDDVDPELLEEHAQQKGSEQDYRDSNSDSREGNHIMGGLISKEATELVRWADKGRAHVALKIAGTKTVIASWWDEHVSDAVDKGDLDPQDMHTSAYRYAATHRLLPLAPMGKKAARTARTAALEFVDPEGPEWYGFVEKLRGLPEGAQIQTKDGYTLTKSGDTFGDGDIMFMLQDFTGTAKDLLPPVAIKTATNEAFIGQQREDGSWMVQGVPEETAEATAESITDAPDGNTAEVIMAPDGDAARGLLHEHMQSKGVTPIETTPLTRATASTKHVLKAGKLYLQVTRTAAVILVEKQSQASRFNSKQAAILWKASESAMAVAGDEDIRVIALKQRC